MKMSKLAVETLKDSYGDRLIDLYEANKATAPMVMVKESKTIWGEISWMEEGSWITSDEATDLWNHVEETVEELLADWERG